MDSLLPYKLMKACGQGKPVTGGSFGGRKIAGHIRGPNGDNGGRPYYAETQSKPF